MGNERMIRTFMMVVIGLTIFGLLRPNSPDPRDDVKADQTWFFINKTHQEAVYDGVIVGDSRALRGVSTAAMGEALPDLKLFNFSFHAGGMNHEMYAQAEKMLRPDAEHKIIVLAPTSLAFMPWKRENSQFNEYLAKPRDQVWLYTKVTWIADFFQSVSPSIYPRKMMDIQPKRYLEQEFHGDGWIATDQRPKDDYANLSSQRQQLSEYEIDRPLIDDFMSQTKTWSDQGITVFAFYPPAFEPRVALEDSMLQFDREAFRDQFEQAGGHWLDVGVEGYETYDGSHLVRESAVKLSGVLGRGIRNCKR